MADNYNFIKTLFMRSKIIYILICLFIVASPGCSKEESTNEVAAGISIQSLSGTYSLKALVWAYGTASINVYDELEECDNIQII